MTNLMQQLSKKLQITINSPTEKQCMSDKFTKGFVSKYRPYTTRWPLKSDKLTIIINSPTQDQYRFDIYSKGFVKKQKPYITKWT